MLSQNIGQPNLDDQIARLGFGRASATKITMLWLRKAQAR